MKIICHYKEIQMYRYNTFKSQLIRRLLNATAVVFCVTLRLACSGFVAVGQDSVGRLPGLDRLKCGQIVSADFTIFTTTKSDFVQIL